ncbi:MAG: tripartite tricarboxylate transporter TctB family protein [Caldimonas sp.]
MRFNDAVWGTALLAFAAALLWHVQGFPTIPGQRVGPSAMPTLLSIGFGVCGAVLLVRGLRQRAGTAPLPWIALPEWFASRPQVLAFAVLVAVNLLYLVAVDRVGFVIVGSIYLTALMLVLRVSAVRAIVVGVLMTLLIHYCFYKLLKVPLPWGLLQPIAW